MIQAFVKPVDIVSLSSLEAEFQKMDLAEKDGLMVVQVRQVLGKDGNRVKNEYHLHGKWIEHDLAAKLIELMKE